MMSTIFYDIRYKPILEIVQLRRGNDGPINGERTYSSCRDLCWLVIGHQKLPKTTQYLGSYIGHELRLFRPEKKRQNSGVLVTLLN